MNPAWSVILFTTVAGAGQGLVVALALAVLAGVGLSDTHLSAGLLLALVMLVFGLGASFFHLGRPARAWRAATMWRTSWLSREVIVLPGFIGAVGLWWLLGSRAPAAWPVVCIVLALALWWCTAMIYACLRFIQEWAHPLTLASFTSIGLASGMLLAGALAALAGESALRQALAPWALLFTLLAGAVRVAALRRNARLVPASTLQSATGIRAARLQQTSMGMTGGAFATREFFHGRPVQLLRQLRWLGVVLAFVLPALLLLVAQRGDSAAPWLLALLLHVPGLLAERWLFFAQARHPQNLYYQVVS